jgi:RNA polymerase sigma-70 factor (ECF subfamily)
MAQWSLARLAGAGDSNPPRQNKRPREARARCEPIEPLLFPMGWGGIMTRRVGDDQRPKAVSEGIAARCSQPHRDAETVATDANSVKRLGLDYYRPYLHLLAKLQLGPRLAKRVDASDVVQETYLRATQAIEGFQGEGNDAQTLAWLRRILASVLADTLRRHRIAQRRDFRLEQTIETALDDSSHTIDQALVSALSSPSQHVARHEQSLLVAKAIADLSPQYQQVLLARHVEELDFSRIAASMGRSVDSVRHLWVRALAALRDRLGQQSMWGGEPHEQRTDIE